MALELTLQRAPSGAWRTAACDYGLLIDLLQGCEQALRGAGLQRSGEQLHRLLTAFLEQQRQRGLIVGEQEDAPAQPMALPRRQTPRPRRRRIPGAGRII